MVFIRSASAIADMELVLLTPWYLDTLSPHFVVVDDNVVVHPDVTAVPLPQRRPNNASMILALTFVDDNDVDVGVVTGTVTNSCNDKTINVRSISDERLPDKSKNRTASKIFPCSNDSLAKFRERVDVGSTGRGITQGAAFSSMGDAVLEGAVLLAVVVVLVSRRYSVR